MPIRIAKTTSISTSVTADRFRIPLVVMRPLTLDATHLSLPFCLKEPSRFKAVVGLNPITTIKADIALQTQTVTPDGEKGPRDLLEDVHPIVRLKVVFE